MSDNIIVFWQRCVKTVLWSTVKPWDSFATLERILVQHCLEIPLVENLEKTHTTAGDWEVGFWVSGVLDSTTIFLWKHNQIELLLCVSYISCEKHRCSRDPISVSAAPVLYYVVPVNYIQYERARLRLMDLKQSKRKHWYIVLLHTHTYMHTETKFNVVTSFKAVNVKRDHWQFKVIGKPRNKNKFGAWHAVGKE